MANPATDARQFGVNRLIADARDFFGLAPHIAAGGLYGRSGTMRVQDAYGVIVGWLGSTPPGSSALSDVLSAGDTLLPPGAAAPFRIAYEAVTFLGVADPFLKVGYNVGGVVSSEPQFYLGIEGNYKIASGAEGFDSTGTHLLQEAYFNYASPDGTSVVNFRPIYIGVLRDGNSSHAAHISFDIGNAGFPNSQLLVRAGNADLFTVSSAGLFFPAAGGGFDVKLGSNYVQSMPSDNTNWSAPWTNMFATTMTANRLYYMGVYIAVPCVLTGIAVYNDSVAAGNLLAALYSADGNTRFAASASTPMAGTFGVQRIPFSAPLAVVPGLYFISLMNSGNTGRWAQGNPFGRAAFADQGGFALPATISPAGPTLSAQVPILSTY